MQLTTNQRYGGLNKRFDNRASRLRALGFEYVRIEQFGIAVFAPQNQHRRKRDTIPASAVMHASAAEWIDILASHLQRGR